MTVKMLFSMVKVLNIQLPILNQYRDASLERGATISLILKNILDKAVLFQHVIIVSQNVKLFNWKRLQKRKF